MEKNKKPVCSGKCDWVGAVEIAICNTCGMVDEAYQDAVVDNDKKKEL